jgi:hypothetical protein
MRTAPSRGREAPTSTEQYTISDTMPTSSAPTAWAGQGRARAASGVSNMNAFHHHATMRHASLKPRNLQAVGCNARRLNPLLPPPRLAHAHISTNGRSPGTTAAPRRVIPAGHSLTTARCSAGKSAPLSGHGRQTCPSQTPWRRRAERGPWGADGRTRRWGRRRPQVRRGCMGRERSRRVRTTSGQPLDERPQPSVGPFCCSRHHTSQPFMSGWRKAGDAPSSRMSLTVHSFPRHCHLRLSGEEAAAPSRLTTPLAMT